MGMMEPARGIGWGRRKSCVGQRCACLVVRARTTLERAESCRTPHLVLNKPSPSSAIASFSSSPHHSPRILFSIASAFQPSADRRFHASPAPAIVSPPVAATGSNPSPEHARSFFRDFQYCFGSENYQF